MNLFKKSVLSLAWCVVLSSCSIPMYSVFKSTPEGEFTSGIEGPAADYEGNIYAVNYEEQGTIGITTKTGESRIFVRLPEGSTGNGIRVNKDGNLLVADYTGHNILQIDRKTKRIQVFAHSDRMNQPNDLAIAKNGLLFLSDPNWTESTGNLWRVNHDGHIIQLETNMGTTNGIEISPDEQRLYVNESVQRKVWVYDLSERGDISNKKLFYQFPDHGLDGMRCDVMGNIYITRFGKGTVAVLSPEGKLLREIKLVGKNPTNITFAGEAGTLCYVTLMDRGSFEIFKTEHPGREWSWYH